MENPINPWMIWGKPTIEGNTYISICSEKMQKISKYNTPQRKRMESERLENNIMAFTSHVNFRVCTWSYTERCAFIQTLITTMNQPVWINWIIEFLLFITVIIKYVYY